MFFPPEPKSFKRGKKLLFFIYMAGTGSLIEAKNCLLFVHPTGLGNLRDAKSCFLFVYLTELGSLQRQNFVCCWFIIQGQEFKRGKKLFIFCLSDREG